MKRYCIEEAKCGITAGGMACGPVPGTVIVSVKFREDTASAPKWFCIAECGGIPNYLLFDKDMHDVLLEEDFDDELYAYLDKHYARIFNGVPLSDYSELFSCMARDPENPAIPLIRYAVALVRCKMEDVDDLIRMAEGRYADELDIPVSDVEEVYRKENDDE